MAKSLNYQPSHSALYYTAPGRIDIERTILAVLGAIILLALGVAVLVALNPNHGVAHQCCGGRVEFGGSSCHFEPFD